GWERVGDRKGDHSRADRTREGRSRADPFPREECGGGASDLRGCGGSGRDQGCGGTEWRASRRGGCRVRKQSRFEFRSWGTGIHGNGREGEIGKIQLTSDSRGTGERG